MELKSFANSVTGHVPDHKGEHVAHSLNPIITSSFLNGITQQYQIDTF